MSNLDRRIRKSQEAIKTALVELMLEKTFDQITIQDLSDKADVSRRTIYLHYLDKYDLLDQLIAEHMVAMHTLCDSTDENDNYTDMGLIWFQYFERHFLFFSAMLASKGEIFFRNQFLAFVIQELNKGKTVWTNGKNQGVMNGAEVDFQFLGAAIVGVVEWWFKNKMPYSPAFMAERVGALLERNLEAIFP